MLDKLYKKIAESCCIVTVYLNGELISEGSGFCFLETGAVATAAHVVTGRFPITESDVVESGVRIFAKFRNRDLIEYKVSVCGIYFRANEFKGELQADLAILLPLSVQLGMPALALNINPPSLGEELYMAGFSDELKIPFGLEKITAQEITLDMIGPLIKRSVVGNIVRVNVGGNLLDLFYLDNSMHYGASGGPVVNKEGDVVGVIHQRAITVIEKDKDKVFVPSGCTICLGFAPLLLFANR